MKLAFAFTDANAVALLNKFNPADLMQEVKLVPNAGSRSVPTCSRDTPTSLPDGATDRLLLAA